jgi:predicted O-methyltransferase YrrM
MRTAASIHQVLDRLAADGATSTVISRHDGTTHHVFPVGISLAEGQALTTWIVRERVSQTIEIGLAYAISTLHICAGLLEVTGSAAPHHVALDPHQESHFGNCGLQLLEDAGVRDMVEHISGRSEFILPDLLRHGRNFELAFVDGNHRFDGVFIDLFYLSKLVTAGGLIIVDDFQLPGVRKAVRFYLNNLQWSLLETSAAHPEHQWAVIRTSTQPDERPFTYFVEF